MLGLTSAQQAGSSCLVGRLDQALSHHDAAAIEQCSADGGRRDPFVEGAFVGGDVAPFDLEEAGELVALAVGCGDADTARVGEREVVECEPPIQ